MFLPRGLRSSLEDIHVETSQATFAPMSTPPGLILIWYDTVVENKPRLLQVCRQCCCKSAQSCILFRDDANHKLGQNPHFTHVVFFCFFTSATHSKLPDTSLWLHMAHCIIRHHISPQNTIWKLTSCSLTTACSKRKHFSRSLISGPTLTHVKVRIFENKKGFKRRRLYFLISSFSSKCCCATAHRLTAPTWRRRCYLLIQWRQAVV